METVFFVKIITNVRGTEFIEYAGLRGEKTLAMINGQTRKMRRIHGWKTLKGAEKYIEAYKKGLQTGWPQKYEIVHS